METLTERYDTINPGELAVLLRVSLNRLIQAEGYVYKTVNHQRRVLQRPGARYRFAEEVRHAIQASEKLHYALLDCQEFALHLNSIVEPQKDLITYDKKDKPKYTKVPATVTVPGYTHTHKGKTKFVPAGDYDPNNPEPAELPQAIMRGSRKWGRDNGPKYETTYDWCLEMKRKWKERAENRGITPEELRQYNDTVTILEQLRNWRPDADGELSDEMPLSSN